MEVDQVGQVGGLMSEQEAMRWAVIKRVQDKQLNQTQAARQLGLSRRQVIRLCKAVDTQGAKGLIAKRRGQPSKRRVWEVPGKSR